MSEQTNSKQSKHRNMKPTDQIGVKREALVREVCRDEVQPRSAGSHPTTPGAILGSSTTPAKSTASNTASNSASKAATSSTTPSESIATTSTSCSGLTWGSWNTTTANV